MAHHHHHHHGEGRPHPKRYLFDCAHAQRSGKHADWSISGGISDWANALRAEGHMVAEIARGNKVTYNQHGITDLSKFDVFVSVEPNARFEHSEIEAILHFVRNGGGLFLVSDHADSDRDFDGWDSVRIWNEQFLHPHPEFGFVITKDNVGMRARSAPVSDESISPILRGVKMIEFNAGATIAIHKDRNPTVKGLIWTPHHHFMCVSSEVGNGRVFAIGDSSPFDDGTTSMKGKILYNGWGSMDHKLLALNACHWLAKNLN